MTKKDEMRCSSRRSVPLFFLIEHPDRGRLLVSSNRREEGEQKEEGSWSREVLLKGHSGEQPGKKVQSVIYPVFSST